MSAYHYSERIVSVPRGSALATSAYISGEARHDPRTGERLSYGGEDRVEAHGMEIPPEAPRELLDPQIAWSSLMAAERAAAERSGSTAQQAARSIDAALPRGLSQTERAAAAQAYAGYLARQGMVVEWAVHEDPADRNPHAHFLASIRPLRSRVAYDPGRPEALWAREKTKTAYLCRDQEGGEGWLMSWQFNAIKGTGLVSKVYEYRPAGKPRARKRLMTPAEAEAAGGLVRARKQPVDKAVGVVPWTELSCRKEVLIKHRHQWALIWNSFARASWEARAEDDAQRDRQRQRDEQREPDLRRSRAPEEVSHLSYAARGIDRPAQRHEGPRGHRNRSAVDHNAMVREWIGAHERVRAARRRLAAALGRLRDALATAPIDVLGRIESALRRLARDPLATATPRPEPPRRRRRAYVPPRFVPLPAPAPESGRSELDDRLAAMAAERAAARARSDALIAKARSLDPGRGLNPGRDRDRPGAMAAAGLRNTAPPPSRGGRPRPRDRWQR